MNKNNSVIGYIDMFAIYLGDDIIIKKIVVHDDKKLSEDLTENLSLRFYYGLIEILLAKI